MTSEAVYDDWAGIYERLYPDLKSGVEEAKRVFARFLSALKPGADVLDVGCGIGLTSLALGELGFNVTGIDVSGKSLQRASELAGTYDGLVGQVTWRKADIATLDANGSYDAVVAMATLIGHLLTEEAQSLALRNMVRALKPGGVLILGCHDYARLLELEPDDHVTPVGVIGAGANQRLIFQKRSWQGRPRQRVHRCTYHFIEADGGLTRIAQDARAITSHELTQGVMAAGGVDVAWIEPERSGYYQPILIARRRGEVSERRQTSRLFAYRASATVTRSRRSLVMWSGGPNSVDALARCLRDTSDEVQVHHIRGSEWSSAKPHTDSPGGHGLNEAFRVLGEIKRASRPFDVKFSTIGPLAMRQQTDLMNVVGYMAAQAALSWQLTQYDRVILGTFGVSDMRAIKLDDPYESGRFLVTQMLKTVMRTEEIPAVIVGA